MNKTARREWAARKAALRSEGMAHWASMVCPRCGEPLRHNNSLAGTIWLQCLTPQSLTPANGCGWQFLFEREG